MRLIAPALAIVPAVVLGVSTAQIAVGPNEPVGVWTNISPAAIPLNLPAGNNCNYGTLAIALDPLTPSTIYLGSCQLGMYKSLDSGTSWTKIDSGTNAKVIDGSRQWTLAIDPVTPQVIYTNAGYGPDGENGAYKSTDGGVNWTRIWPSRSQRQDVVQYNFVAQVSIDPTDHVHVFLSWHGSCAKPYTAVCYGESHDGGTTWTIRSGDPRWVPSEAQTIYILDAQHWLFANHSDGLWRSSDAGKTWALIDSHAAGHWPSTVYHSPVNGAYYIGSDHGLYRSLDFENWSLLPVGYIVTGILGDGTTLFLGKAGALTPWVPAGTNVYMTSPETDGTNWTPAPWTYPESSMFTQGPGGGFAYDRVNHYLFSSNGTAGLWRVKIAAAAGSGTNGSPLRPGS
jgi:photosystem II stability/assembly factor-like uncharacterized protein